MKLTNLKQTFPLTDNGVSEFEVWGTDKSACVLQIEFLAHREGPASACPDAQTRGPPCGNKRGLISRVDSREYVLWMKRYGVLPDSYDLRSEPFDP